jgi:hypothetical protein
MLFEAVVLKFVPVRITGVPADPDEGLMLVITGCALTLLIRQMKMMLKSNKLLLRIFFLLRRCFVFI